MRYAKRFTVLISAIFMLACTLVVDISAQSGRRTVKRPVVVRYWVRDPFWYSRGMYDPFYDPYFYDPYLREQRERYYREKAVKDARKKIAKNNEKYGSDGVLTAKERKKLNEDREKYGRAVRRLNEFNRDSD